MEKGIEFSINEIKTLYRLIEYEWIPREDDEITAVVNKISQIVGEDVQLADRPSETT